jgi:hypothetical protein
MEDNILSEFINIPCVRDYCECKYMFLLELILVVSGGGGTSQNKLIRYLTPGGFTMTCNKNSRNEQLVR